MNKNDKNKAIKNKISYKNYLMLLFILSNSLAFADEVKVGKNEIKENVVKNLEHESSESSVFGKFGITGNGVGLIKGNSTVENEGKIKGKIVAVGKDNKDAKDKRGSFIIEGQGNGVSNVAYSPFSNKRDLDKGISSAVNSGYIGGELKITGGNALQNGEISTSAAGNGILSYSLADYGEVNGSEGGDTGVSVDAVAGGSRGGRRIKSTPKRISKPIMAAPKSEESKPVEIDPTRKPDPADWNGKDVVTKIENLENDGTIEGKVVTKTVDGYSRGMSPIPELNGAEGLDPQWRSQNINTSGNGIVAATYVTTPTKHTFGEDKVNRAIIGTILNNGKIQGKVDAKSGNGGTLTYAHAEQSGNAISANAYTFVFAKNKTTATIDKVENYGTLTGDVKIVAGNNSAQGYHEYSNAKASGSGNGISTYMDARNYNVKEAKSIIGEVTNRGAIKGSIYAKAGAGNGENMAIIEASGNGVSAFGRAARKNIEIGDVNNFGIISGNAVVYGGKDAKGLAKNVEDKLFILPIDFRAEEKIENVRDDFSFRGKNKFTDKFGSNPVDNINDAIRNETLETTYKKHAVKDVEKIEEIYGGKGNIKADDKVKLYRELYNIFTAKTEAADITVKDEYRKLQEHHIKEANVDVSQRRSALNKTKKAIEEIIERNGGEENLGKGFDYLTKSFKITYDRDMKILADKQKEIDEILLQFKNKKEIDANNAKIKEIEKNLESEKINLAARGRQIEYINNDISNKRKDILSLKSTLEDLKSGKSFEPRIKELTNELDAKKTEFETKKAEAVKVEKLDNYYSKISGLSYDFQKAELLINIDRYKTLMNEIAEDKLENRVSNGKQNPAFETVLKKIKDSVGVNRGWDDPTYYTNAYNKEFEKLKKENPVLAREKEVQYLEAVIRFYGDKLKYKSEIEGYDILKAVREFKNLSIEKTNAIVKLKEKENELRKELETLKGDSGSTNKEEEIAKVNARIADIENEIKTKEAEVATLTNTESKVEKLNAEIEKIKKANEELAKNTIPVSDSRGMIDDTIQTTSFIYGSGNGISVHQEGDTGNKLGNVVNEGVISGYSEIYNGYGQNRYTRVAYHQNGAGISVRSDVDSKITNAGLISGNNFALLAKGRLNDSQSVFHPTYESGFKGGVDNYGMLAGRVIIGGYQVSAMAPEDYVYYETIFADPTKYNNYGMFVKLDKNGEPVKVYVDESKKGATYNGKEIVNIAGMDDSYTIPETNEISSKIINAVGNNGAVKVAKDTEVTVNKSIINAYKNAIVLDDESSISLKGTVVNANGFGEAKAILGTEGNNTLILGAGNTINGKIDLRAGDDTLIIKGNSYLNSSVDLGSGDNRVVIDKESSNRRVRRAAVATDDTITISSEINNVGNLEINSNTILKPTARIGGVEGIKVADGKKLVYEFIDAENHPFASMVKEGETPKVLIDAKEGNFVINPVGEEFALGYSKDILKVDLVLKKAEESQPIAPSQPVVTPVTPAPQPVVTPTTPVAPLQPVVTPVTPQPENRGTFITDLEVENVINKTKGTNKDITGVYSALKESIKKGEIKLEDIFVKLPKAAVKGVLEKIVYKNKNANTLTSSLAMQASDLKETLPNEHLQKGEMKGKAVSLNMKENLGKDSETSAKTVYGKVEYGLGNGKTVAFNVGGGRFRNEAFSSSDSTNLIGVGTSLTHKIDNFEYTVGVSMQKIDGKKGAIQEIKGYGAYGEVKYNMPLNENWTVSPKASVTAISYKQKELKQENVVINSKKGLYKEAGVGVEIARKGYIGNGALTLNTGVEYDIRSNNSKDTKAHFVGSSQDFKLDTKKLKNKTEAKFGASYQHASGVFVEANVKVNLNNKKDRRFSTTVGYKF